MSPRQWAWLRPLAGVAILVALVVQLGADPFTDGLRRTDATAVVVALVVTAGTTWCCAWRWSLLSARLGVVVPVRTAFRRYYRSQLLNATLPGGVLGDVHRGVEHGRASGSMRRGVGSVVAERAAGQLVQAAMAAAALPLLPGGLGPDDGWTVVPVAAGLAAAVVLVVVLGWRVVVASVLASAGHVVVFVVAARSVGVDASLSSLTALGLVVLVAASVPLSVAGWGPREGAAAWLFAGAGLGAATGLSVAVAFGVVSLVATLPGLLVLTERRADVGPLPDLEEADRG
ncbi:lysylphosphatidylglycerol synthase transmembrane domain-containing protein [Nocardioides silvaticus]|uniref:lysylphosphatidylglycerol synthase transmembrane domain-containing protein n=1 Tax=Nocardioides silvaticus TaxID=2201891 RepID=UPI001FE599B7|nr:lysylphosphatidylglycerol synthase transmembrane domain-containing protein [Nocardioides silvaticus]